MANRDRIEYYNADCPAGRDLIAAIDSSMVPPVGAKISIRKVTWEVMFVSYCLDDAGCSTLSRMRACVNLLPAE